MPIGLELECNVEQACRFSPVKKLQFGYLTALTIDTEATTADIMVADPMQSTSWTWNPGTATSATFTKPAVAVLTSFSWPDGRWSDQLSFSIHTSAKTAAILESIARRQTAPKGVQVSFSLIVFAWDYLASSYYVRFCSGSDSSGSTLNGILADGSVDDEPQDAKHLGNIHFKAKIKVAPSDSEQNFYIATSKTNKKTLTWGQKSDGEAEDVVNAATSGSGSGAQQDDE